VLVTRFRDFVCPKQAIPALSTVVRSIWRELHRATSPSHSHDTWTMLTSQMGNADAGHKHVGAKLNQDIP